MKTVRVLAIATLVLIGAYCPSIALRRPEVGEGGRCWAPARGPRPIRTP